METLFKEVRIEHKLSGYEDCGIDSHLCRISGGISGKRTHMKQQLFIIVKKIATFLAALLVLSALVFFVSRMTPADPLQSYYGERMEKMSEEQKEAAREKLGLNDALPVQYIRWASLALQGDFGISYKYKQPVTTVIAGRIGNTLLLGGVGFVIVFAGAAALGLFCAKKEGSKADAVICKIGTISSCIPEFWLSLVLILVFSVTLRLLPSSGAYSVGKSDDIGDRIEHLILPLSVVVLSHLWYYAYMMRNRLIEETRKEYVLLGRSEGLSNAQVMRRHCLRNALPSYLTMMAVSVPHILGGTYIVEMVFSYPGLGTLSYESARYADYNMLMVLCLLTGAVVIVCNRLAQMIAKKLDPRVREASHPHF